MAMLQSLLFVRPADDCEVNRIINIELLATAAACGDNLEKTEVYSAGVRIELGMKFTDFMKQVEKLIAENYRISMETDAKWHQKRVDDTNRLMTDMVEKFRNH